MGHWNCFCSLVDRFSAGVTFGLYPPQRPRIPLSDTLMPGPGTILATGGMIAIALWLLSVVAGRKRRAWAVKGRVAGMVVAVVTLTCWGYAKHQYDSWADDIERARKERYFARDRDLPSLNYLDKAIKEWEEWHK